MFGVKTFAIQMLRVKTFGIQVFVVMTFGTYSNVWSDDIRNSNV